jgi:segregation and condensation protein B
MSSHISALEALLFIHGEPIKRDSIARALHINSEEVSELLETFKAELERSERGLLLLEQNEEYMLVTKPQFATLVETFVKEGLKEDLTPAASETLSLVAYFGPIARSHIDYIRGVNSSFILRALLVRGLINRTYKGNAFLYEPSADFLRYMGIARVESLPHYEEYQAMKEKLFETHNQAEQTEEKAEVATISEDPSNLSS